MMMRARQKYPDVVAGYEEAPTQSPIHRIEAIQDAINAVLCAMQCSGSEEEVRK
jgi:hypothetical protein